MAIDRDDILEALGIRESGFGEWFGPALIGFGVGALVGAAAALLLAPKSGADLRSQLTGKAREAFERGREKMEAATGSSELGREPTF